MTVRMSISYKQKSQIMEHLITEYCLEDQKASLTPEISIHCNLYILNSAPTICHMFRTSEQLDIQIMHAVFRKFALRSPNEFQPS